MTALLSTDVKVLVPETVQPDSLNVVFFLPFGTSRPLRKF